MGVLRLATGMPGGKRPRVAARPESAPSIRAAGQTSQLFEPHKSAAWSVAGARRAQKVIAGGADPG
jgi:hypothetical protein